MCIRASHSVQQDIQEPFPACKSSDSLFLVTHIPYGSPKVFLKLCNTERINTTLSNQNLTSGSNTEGPANHWRVIKPVSGGSDTLVRSLDSPLPITILLSTNIPTHPST